MDLRYVIIFLSTTLTFFFSSCGKDSGTDDPNNPNGNGGEQTTLTISPNELTFKSEGEEKTFAITSNSAWTITNPSTWCKINPAQGNNNAMITATADPSEEYDDRNFNLTIKAGEITKVVTITQKKKDAIILTKERYDIPTEGDYITFEVKSNITYSVIIPAEHSEWIKQVETKQLGRGLETKNLNFKISTNPNTDKREGIIVIKDNGSSLADTIHVYQAQKDELILTQDTYNVSSEGEIIHVELRSNVDYDIFIPEDVQEWIHQLPTKSLKVDQLIFSIQANLSNNNRSAKISIKDKNSDLNDTLYIQQKANETINVIFQTEQDVINFSQKMNEIITGNLMICGKELKTLQKLENRLVEVKGDLIIDCASLTTLDGLYGLTKIGGDLIISKGQMMTLEGLNNLESIEGDLNISLSPSTLSNLKSFKCLEKLSTIGGSFKITASQFNSNGSSSGIESFEGLNNLKYIGLNFEINAFNGGLNALKSFEGLENLTTIGESFKVIASSGDAYSSVSLDALKSFKGLNALNLIGGNFKIQAIDSVSSPYASSLGELTFEGLNNLTAINGDFSIKAFALGSDKDNWGTCEPLKNLVCFKGLNKLHRIGGNFKIDAYSDYKKRNTMALASLTSFEGLENLYTIEGDFTIKASTSYGRSLPRLTFNGLNALKQINGNFEINISNLKGGSERSLRDFTSFEGLENLSTIGGNFKIIAYQSNCFESFKGLNKLKHIGNDFEIRASGYNTLGKCTSLKGLDNLSYIGGSLKIEGVISDYALDGLESLEGLTQLKTISNKLSITGCKRLNNINALISLTTVKEITITDCPAIYDFCIIKNVVQENNSSFYTTGNGYNPTKYQLLNGQCSDISKE